MYDSDKFTGSGICNKFGQNCPTPVNSLCKCWDVKVFILVYFLDWDGWMDNMKYQVDSRWRKICEEENDTCQVPSEGAPRKMHRCLVGGMI